MRHEKLITRIVFYSTNEKTYSPKLKQENRKNEKEATKNVKIRENDYDNGGTIYCTSISRGFFRGKPQLFSL